MEEFEEKEEELISVCAEELELKEELDEELREELEDEKEIEKELEDTIEKDDEELEAQSASFSHVDLPAVAMRTHDRDMHSVC